MTLLHLLEHLLGMDNINGPIYAFWSGSGDFLLGLIIGLQGYFRLKRHHRQEQEKTRDHIDAHFAKLTGENIQQPWL